MKKRLREDNRGFSLVELIVVMAIVAILVGATVSLFRQITFANTEKAAETISANLEKARVTAMSKSGNNYIYIYKLDDGYYMKSSSVLMDALDAAQLDKNGVKICNNNIKIYRGGASGTLVDGSEVIRIRYTKTGVFHAETNVFSGSGTEGQIVVNGVGDHTISLIKTTGKNYVD